MTQLIDARNGIITKEMKELAKDENMEPDVLRQKIADGRVVITKNKKHNIRGLAIGEGLTTKVNANIGSSQDKSSVDDEIEKLHVAEKAGAHALMDLSTGGDISAIRKRILAEATIPLGTVPIYQAIMKKKLEGKNLFDLTSDELFEVIEEHGEDGVDFITVHCGVTRASVAAVKKHKRITGIVSRGGALTAEWMAFNKKENPLYEEYDRLLEICKKYDMTISLGDGLRPGSLHDATDRGQISELVTLGELAQRSLDAGVQVMIEGPGHVPLNQIQTNMQIQKRLCNNVPFYVLGPLVTDVAPGYDHITSAIGGAIASASGADFLCYVTPAEHLRLPNAQDVHDGVIATRIAAHAGDIAKGIPGAIEWDHKLSKARKALDWKEQIRLSMDPPKAESMREETLPEDEDVCSMCGTLCSMKVTGNNQIGDDEKAAAAEVTAI